MRTFFPLPHVVALVASLFLYGCRSASGPAYPEMAAPATGTADPAPAPATAVDDIPANASPAVRAHILRLREMRDLGQISEAQYQSRRAMLLPP